MKGERFGVFSAFMMYGVFSFVMFSRTDGQNADLISLALAQLVIVPSAAAGSVLLSAAFKRVQPDKANYKIIKAV